VTALQFAIIALRAEARNYTEAQKHDEDEPATDLQAWKRLAEAAIRFSDAWHAAQRIERNRGGK